MSKIKNDRQLAVSKKWLREFERSLQQARRDSKDLHPRLRQAQVDGIRSQIRDLKNEIDEYIALRRRSPGYVPVNSLEDLPDALVRVRIARRLTQEDLASDLGVKPQQVQKWEAGAYQRATYGTIVKVASALGIVVKGKAEK